MAEFGLLKVMRVELPYESPAAQAEADKMNAQIKALGFRTFRMGYDWGVERYEDIRTNISKGRQFKIQPQDNIKALRSGDLVKVFKTVSDGDVHWQGVVNFSTEKYHHGLQKRFNRQEWARMFNDQMPVKLERDGKVIFGALEPFAETGTEGVIWCVAEYGKAGYDALQYLKNGDRLSVFSAVRDGDVEWEGVVDFGPEKIEKIGWSEVLRVTKHMDTEKWLQMSWQRRPVMLTPC